MRPLYLIAAIILIAIAVGAALVSQNFFQMLLTNDGLWGQGQWGVTGHQQGNQFIIEEFFITDRGKGRAFFIRFLAVVVPVLTALAFMVAWNRHHVSTSVTPASDTFSQQP